jgi:hypothetical protein
MTNELKELISRAQGVKMTAREEQEQRISFVYGNTNIENGRITKELVEEVDAQLNGSSRKK